MRRKLLSVLLTLSMVLAWLPSAALADGTENGIPDPAGNEIVTDQTEIGDAQDTLPDPELPTPSDVSGGTTTPSGDGLMPLAEDTMADKLSAFVGESGTGETITLDSDVTLNSELQIRRSVTIDLGGHTLTTTAANNDDGIWVKDDLTVTIKNGTVTINAAENASYIYGIIASAGSNLTLEGVTLSAEKGTGIFTRGAVVLTGSSISAVTGVTLATNAAASVTMDGGKITTTGTGGSTAGIFANGGTADSRKTITVNGGTIESASYGIAIRDYTTLSVNGGSVKGTYGITTNGTDRNTHVTVASGAAVTGTDIGIYAPAPIDMRIGGTVAGPIGIVCRGADLTVENGAVITANGSQGSTAGDSSNTVPPAAVVLDNASGYAGGSVKILGGTISAANGQKVVAYLNGAGDASNFLVTGGTFSSNPFAGDTDGTGVTAPAGYRATEDENTKKWTVAAVKGELVVDKPTSVDNGTVSGTIAGEYIGNNTETDDDVEVSGGNVVFDLTTGTNSSGEEGPAPNDTVKTAAVNVPAATAESLTRANSTEIHTDVATIELDSAAMGTIAAAATEGESGKMVTIEVKDTTPTSSSGGTTSGPEKVVEVSVKVDGKNVLPEDNSAENGSITITVAVTLSGTDTEVHVYYGVLSGGTFTPISEMANAIFKDGKVTFTTDHLSEYAVYTSALSEETMAEAVAVDASGKVTGAGTLASLVSSASGETVITLNKDVVLNSTLTINNNKNITINGRGHTISAGENLKNQEKSTVNVINLGSKGDTNDTSQLTLGNVNIDAKSQCRAVYCTGKTKLTINDGTVVKNGKALDYVGGVYVSGGAGLTMNGGVITENNKNGDKYNDDGYLQFCADLWIGNNAQGTLNGGTVGNAFVNATTAGGNVGGNLSVAGAAITNVYVEAEANHSGDVVTYTDGSIENLYIAMDYDTVGDRVTVLIENPTPAEGTESSPAITGLTIPAGETATVVTRGDKTEYTLTHDITIGEGATLIIPEDITVTVKKPATSGGGATTLPEIKNNGTLVVDGSLMAEAASTGADPSTDSNTVTITGGAIQGSGTIDIDKDGYEEITITFDGNGGTPATQEVTLLLKKESSGAITPVKLSDINVEEPARSGYTFDYWMDSTGKEVAEDKNFFEDATLAAHWTKDVVPPTPPVTPPDEPNPPVTPDEYTITFDSKGGSAVSPVTTVNGMISALPMPVRTGYIFQGWVKADGTPVSSATVFTEDTTVYASWLYAGYPGTPVSPVTPVTPNPGGTAPSRPSETPDASEAPSTPEDPGSAPSTPSTAPTTPGVRLPFVDVLASDWYNEAVKYVYGKGIMNGTDTARFSPNATTTRGMIVTILYRLEGEPGAGASTFADVPAGQWYTGAVAWAAANNIVGGYGDGRFGPNDTITREQLAAIFYRYAKYKGYGTIERASLSGYADAGQISAYALEPMQWASSAGLINGVTETTLAPTGSATRAQVAAILMRFCENIAK